METPDKKDGVLVRCWRWQKDPQNRTGPLFFATLCDAIVFISATQAAAEELWAGNLAPVDPGGPFRRLDARTIKPWEAYSPYTGPYDAERIALLRRQGKDPLLLTPMERGLLWTVVGLGFLKWLLIVLRCLQFRERLGGIVECVLVTLQVVFASATMGLFIPRVSFLNLNLVASTFYLTLCITICFCVPSLILRLVDLALGSPEKISYAKRDFIVTTWLALLVLVIGAFIFDAVEGWDYNRGLIFCVVFFTTIGYGNDTPKTSAGKLLAIFYGTLGMVIFLNYLLAMRNVIVESIELRLRPVVENRVRQLSKKKYEKAEREMASLDTKTIEYDMPKDVQRKDAGDLKSMNGTLTTLSNGVDATAMSIAAQKAGSETVAQKVDDIATSEDLKPLPLPLSPDPEQAEPDHDGTEQLGTADTSQLANYWADHVHPPVPEESETEQARGQAIERTGRMDLKIEETEPVESIKEAWGAEVGQIPATGDPRIDESKRVKPGDLVGASTAVNGNGNATIGVPASGNDLADSPAPGPPNGKVNFVEPDPMRSYFNSLTTSPTSHAVETEAETAAAARAGRLSRAKRIDPGRMKMRRRATWFAVAGDLFAEEEMIQVWTDRLIAIGMCGFTLLWWLGGAGIYTWLERWDYLDSVYFTYISITTTGFGDLYPLTASGWLFWLYYGGY